MNMLVSQILFAMLLPPVAVVFTVALALFVYGYLGANPHVSIVGLMVFGFTWVYWCALWRKTVRWSARRVLETIVTTIVCAAVIVMPRFFIDFGWQTAEFTFVFTSLGIVAFLMLTIVFWRDTPGERAARLRMQAGGPLGCPTCGYDMTGLHDARCPECGSVFTLDQLLVSRRGDTLQDAPLRPSGGVMGEGTEKTGI